MGGGSYNYIKARSRSTDYSTRNTKEIFSRSSMSPEMNIYNRIRESRDSEEHPESFPIIIALDTTGSMDDIPRNIITNALPEIMKSILDAGIPHPQVCFLGVGDVYRDRDPLQCGQFESSDDLMEKWLKLVHLEGGGGGNGGESYNLAWYFAARHTSIDSFINRNKKGALITIGDEPCHKALSNADIKSQFGDSVECGFNSQKLLEMAREQWEPYHIHMGNGRWDYSVIEGWKHLIGDNHLIVLPREDYKLIPVITSIIHKVYNTSEESVEASDISEEKKKTKITL